MTQLDDHNIFTVGGEKKMGNHVPVLQNGWKRCVISSFTKKIVVQPLGGHRRCSLGTAARSAALLRRRTPPVTIS